VTLLSPPSPCIQESNVYNDTNQLTTTQTSVGGQPGYTFSDAYDSTTGVLTGMSTTTTGAPTLASLGYNAQAQISTLRSTIVATRHLPLSS
jgi:hypothetical protein